MVAPVGLVLQLLVASPATSSVLVVVRTPNDPALSSVVESALEPELDHRPLLEHEIVADRDELGGQIFGCGGDVGCVQHLLEEREIDLCVRVLIDLRLDPPLYSLELISRERGLLGEDGGMRSSAQTWQSIVRDAASALLTRQGHPYLSRIRVHTKPVNAEVQIQPESKVVRIERGVFAEPGLYEVTASSEGYSPVRTSMSVMAGQDARLDLELVEQDEGWEWPAFALGLGIIGAAAIAGAVVSSATAESRPCVCLSSMGEVCGECPP